MRKYSFPQKRQEDLSNKKGLQEPEKFLTKSSSYEHV